MDRTSILVLVICFLLLMLWYPMVVNKLYPPKPTPVTTNTPAATVTGTNAQPQAQPATSTTPASAQPQATPRITINTNMAEQTVVLANDDARFTFTSHGGGIKLIELLKHQETTSTRRQRQSITNPVILNKYAPAPTLAILGGEAVQGDGIFSLSQAGGVVRAEKELSNGLTIVKEFELETNYLMRTRVRMENRSTQALVLPPQEWVIGTATPIGPKDDGSAVGVLLYNGSKTEDVGATTYFATRGFACMPRTPPTEYRGGASNVFWASAHNQFFAIVYMPTPTQAAEALVVRRLDLPRPTGEEAKYVSKEGPPPQGYETLLVQPSLTLTQGQVLERQVYLYTGPKEYQRLARIADRFGNNVDLVMQFGWSGFVSKALLLSMNWLHEALKFSYGWAIVAITIIIKMIFWPLTASSTRSMKKMQALQPQMASLREKYKDDPQKLNQKTWEFYKKNKVNPMGSCLPMLLQIPVFFGFLQMIRSAIELRGAHWLWVGDLSISDTLFYIPGLGIIPFIGVSGVGLPFNLLPLIMGATMLWQAHLTPPSPGMDPTQQAIMKYLPLLFLVGLYNFWAGLTLYWTVNNLMTILQTKLTRTEPLAPAAPALPAKGPVLTPGQKKRK